MGTRERERERERERGDYSVWYKANKSSPLILPKKQGEVDGCCFGVSSEQAN